MFPDNLASALSDEEILALTIYGEARGESPNGQIAVGCVIRNRVLSRGHDNIEYREVCLAPKQFSCWNDNDPNFRILIEMSKTLLYQNIQDPTFQQCLYFAQGIITEVIKDITNGSENYLTKNLFENRPEWAKNATNVQTIGSQVFFNA